ncbi:MAG: N-acetylmuramoyl-L-alanine amidase [Muribaculaceae bacterium]
MMPSIYGASDKPFTVVLDPGHGGKDYGCVGSITNEKTIVLDVARRVGDMIADELPQVKTVFTRKDDRFIELSERAKIANKANADLFISIHVNSVDKRSKGRENVQGASVYTLGLHRTEANLAVAMRENAVIELEPDFSTTYQGFDPNSSESYIIFELTQNQHLNQSIEFADAVQTQLVKAAGRLDKGVRQAGFLVLRATSMPSVLVELDFICNPSSERYLASEQGRRECATSIFNALRAYYYKHSAGAPLAKTKKSKADKKRTTTAPAAAAADDTPAPRDEAGDADAASTASTTTYHVQILTAPQQLSPDDERIKGRNDVTYYIDNNTYKYIVGSYASFAAAKKALAKLKKHYKGAFIIKMRGGERLK